jgi:hypothetical protein
MGHYLPGHDQSARLRPRHLPPAAEAALQVLHNEHRFAVRHAVRAHHDRVLSAAGMRGENLARHLSSPRLHRFPADDCRKHPENIVGHSANWLEFRQGFMTVGRRLTCNSLAKRTVENFSDDETKMRDVGLFNLCSALVIHIIRNDRRDAILSFENQS